jgi:hypothetical protein
MMDDGCLVKNRGFRFSTNSFTLKEVKFLASILEKKYNLKPSLQKAGTNIINVQYNIYIPKSSFKDLIKIVKPHFHPSMYYKLNII